MNFLVGYLIFISFTSFLIFGADKLQARRNRRRVPENILLLVTLLGGTMGSILAMLIFQHKVSKFSFIIKLAAVIILQVLFYIYCIKKY